MHPRAGGAELMTMQWASEWASMGMEIVFLTNSYPGCKEMEKVGQIKILRRGNPLTQSFHAWVAYRKEGPFDLVIEEINTLPFFSCVWARKRSILLIFQLAREVWFYEVRRPLGAIGFVLEHNYMKLYRRSPAITESLSTKEDLVRLGFDPKKIQVVPIGTDDPPDGEAWKFETFTCLYVGRLTPSKRVDHVIRAFKEAALELAARGLPCRLLIVGDGPDEKRLRGEISRHSLDDLVEVVGRVSRDKRNELMARAHVLLLASVREGWGLVVTEANRLGTPAIGYSVAGLVDSIQSGENGILTREDPVEMGKAIAKVALDPSLLGALSHRARVHAKKYTWERSRSAATLALRNAIHHLGLREKWEADFDNQ